MHLLPFSIAPPALKGMGVLVTALQVVIISTSFNKESGEGTQTPYSKFATKQSLSLKVSSRIGMLLIYVPSAVYSMYELISPMVNIDNQRHFILTACLFAHFAKRIFETLFIHKYSGHTSGSVAAFIGIYYAILTWIVINFQNQSIISPDVYIPGLVIFLIGEIGNAYHHILLSRLRRGSGENIYVSPTGGLFKFVATPHYFFELVAWYGIALIAQQGNALLVAMSMTSYLVGRSVATNKWNKINIPGYEDRKNIIPCLF